MDSVADDVILAEEKKEAALLAVVDLTGVVSVVVDVVEAAVAAAAVVVPEAVGLGLVLTTGLSSGLVASVLLIDVWPVDGEEAAASSWIGLKEAPTAKKR